MKRILIFVILSIFTLRAEAYAVRGPQGGIAIKISLPEGFNPETDRCPMVILMHGIFSSKDYHPMTVLAKGLAEAGIASIRFDFNGHGKSEGRQQDMTVEKEIADAMAIYAYVKELPYVTEIGLLGHSQGGVIAAMTAGRLAAQGEAPPRMVLLAPGSIIKEACQAGTFFNAHFDPKNPPEYIRCWGIFKLGREYLLSTQELDIYRTALPYKGHVLILHGTQDTIVPMWCSDRFKEIYGEKASFITVDGETHNFTRRKKEVVRQVVEFFKEL
jgi:hypothetical protein